MKNTSLCAIVCLLLSSCRKEKDGREPEEKKPLVELLTQQKWILAGYGFDDNNNKRIDDTENMIEDCQNDNSYEFFRDSTGVVKENEKVCGAGAPVTNFTWGLGNGNKELFLSFIPATIEQLDEVSLVLRHRIPGLNDSARFTTVFKH
jgi:hypothetical protein